MIRSSGLNASTRIVGLQLFTKLWSAHFLFLQEYVMKTKLLIPALAATLSLPSLSSLAASTSDLDGTSAPAATADRTIQITPDTKYVNVQGGQVVTFDVGGQTFTWNFDVPNGAADSIDLSQIAPAGLLDHQVTAFVSPNPLYS
jgi:hypothetical protein